jgi:hypothetical protein
MQYLIWSLLGQREGNLHPPTGFVAGATFKPKDLGNSKVYDGLTDDSPMGDYAWAFLRRNQFFQMHQEHPLATPSDFDWGFDSTGLGTGTCGYDGDKPYHENACTGAKVSWSILEHVAIYGLKSPEKDRYVAPKRKELNESSLCMVFRLDDYFGAEIDTIDAQLAVAREVLLRRRSALGRGLPATKARRPDLPTLRKILRLADILTPENSEAPFIMSREEIRCTLKEHGYEGENIDAMHTRIGEGIRSASSWIYDFGYLSLLRWESPERIVEGYIERNDIKLTQLTNESNPIESNQ